MLLIKTPQLTVKTKYYFLNNGQHYYQRAVPLHLRRYFEGKRNIQIKLRGDQTSMAVEIGRLAKEHDDLFSALRGGSQVRAQTQSEALALLAHMGLRPGDGNEPAKGVPDGMYAFPHLDLIEEYLRDKDAAGTLTAVDQIAKQLLTKPLPIYLSDAPDIYFENHEKGQNLKYRKDVLKRWKNIYTVSGGDIPLSSLTREMARRYVAERLQHVKTASIEREINVFRAILNVVIRERSLGIPNQFEGVKIPNKGKDSKPRPIFTEPEYQKLIKACATSGGEVQTLILVMCLTGTGPSEVAGLRREDIFLDDRYPHFNLVEYGDRTLKTKNRTRKVPLLPLAATAVGALLASHDEASLAPRYCLEGVIKADNLSAAAKAFIRSLGINKTSYSARHTVRTMLDRADIPEYLIDSIGGWGRPSIGRGYGEGHSLEQKFQALTKSLGPVLNF